MKSAKALFAFSIFYLFAIFAMLLADTIAKRVFMSVGG
jgi:protoheme IX farnesyltransferase